MGAITHSNPQSSVLVECHGMDKLLCISSQQLEFIFPDDTHLLPSVCVVNVQCCWLLLDSTDEIAAATAAQSAQSKIRLVSQLDAPNVFTCNRKNTELS